MPSIPRREVDELVAGYQLHPTLFDIFVEGEFDRDFLYQFFEQVGHADTISVIPIESIDISDSKLIELGLSPGSNKHRVIGLAMLLEQKLGRQSSNISCLVDVDADRLLNKMRADFYVEYTDFTCMEMYALSTDTITRFLTYTCQLDDSHIDRFLGLARAILPTQFITRAAVEKLGLRVSVPDFFAGLPKRGAFDTFDHQRYVDAFLLNHCPKAKKDEASALIKTLRKNVDKHLRHKAHGHDFIYLLFNYLWKQEALKLHNKDEDVLKYGGRLLTTALRIESISTDSLFRRLLWAASGTLPMRQPTQLSALASPTIVT